MRERDKRTAMGGGGGGGNQSPHPLYVQELTGKPKKMTAHFSVARTRKKQC